MLGTGTENRPNALAGVRQPPLSSALHTSPRLPLQSPRLSVAIVSTPDPWGRRNRIACQRSVGRLLRDVGRQAPDPGGGVLLEALSGFSAHRGLLVGASEPVQQR